MMKWSIHVRNNCFKEQVLHNLQNSIGGTNSIGSTITDYISKILKLYATF